MTSERSDLCTRPRKEKLVLVLANTNGTSSGTCTSPGTLRDSGTSQRTGREVSQSASRTSSPPSCSYLDYLRGAEPSCSPGSPMEVAVDYILHRDDQQGASAVVASGGVARYPARGRTRQRTRHSALRFVLRVLLFSVFLALQIT